MDFDLHSMGVVRASSISGRGGCSYLRSSIGRTCSSFNRSDDRGVVVGEGGVVES